MSLNDLIIRRKLGIASEYFFSLSFSFVCLFSFWCGGGGCPFAFVVSFLFFFSFFWFFVRSIPLGFVFISCVFFYCCLCLFFSLFVFFLVCVLFLLEF